MKDEPLKICPKCGKEIRRLINGGSGIIFKGGGFYVTDNGGKGIKSEKPKDAVKTAPDKETGSASCASCSGSETCPKAAG